MLRELLGHLLRIIHTVLVVALWTSPLYLTSPKLLLIAIGIQAAILVQFDIFGDRCSMTYLEEVVSGQKIPYKQGSKTMSMTGFNKVMADLFGLNTMLFLNHFIPHLVILANTCKLLYML